MLLSMKWLNEYVDVSDIDIKDFCHEMTMSGSKVEGYEFESQEIEKVVVGKIVSISKHPDADKLLVCQVDVGGEKNLQIITAAQNVFEGAIVPVALHKSKLAGGISIKKGKLRGLASEGMLCSISELGLSLSDFPGAVEDGILIIEEDCEVGQDIKKALGIDDVIVDFEITPNRPDCLSVIGLAREVSAVFNRPLKYYNNNDIDKNKIDENIIKVSVEDKDLCRRYMVKVVKNVKIGPSPRFIRERLRSSGVRPINNIVDITNYVMLEYGQPVHAFDYDKIFGKNIIVRKAKPGESIKLLDGTEKKLDENMLVIADKDKPLVIAGVMGGEDSGISDNTKTVVFEVANFDPESVRQTSKKVAVRTESSLRFEKGIDNNFSPVVINKICQLINELKIGEIVDGKIDINNVGKLKNREIELKCDVVNNLLGLDLSESEIKDILSKLYIDVEDNKVIVPSWRPDIEGIADISEEVARLYGYNKIKPIKFDKLINPITMRTERQKFENDILDFMTSQGYFEVKTFSFISPKYYDKINLKDDDKLRESVVILNPLGEDTSVMRTTIIPSMIDVVSKNYNNQNLDGRFFELAKVYFPNKDDKTLPEEKDELVIGLYGKKYNFYDLKLTIENLFDKLNIKGYKFIAQDNNLSFHPGRCADIIIGDDKLGIIGQIHPKVQDNYQIPTNVFIVSLKIETMFKNKLFDKIYNPVSKFPSVIRDLSLVCDKDLPVLMIEDIIRDIVLDNLEEIILSDVYIGEQIEKSKKSVCYSLKLRDFEKTLTDEDISIIINNILEKLKTINVYIRPF